MAIDAGKADFAEPIELGLDGKAFVGGIFVGRSNFEGAKETGVEFGGAGGDVF